MLHAYRVNAAGVFIALAGLPGSFPAATAADDLTPFPGGIETNQHCLSQDRHIRGCSSMSERQLPGLATHLTKSNSMYNQNNASDGAP